MQKYKGEEKCEALYKSGVKKGKQCENGGYYLQAGQVFCGVHSNKNFRSDLPVNPDAGKIKIAENTERENMVVDACVRNAKAGRSGDVICSKLSMRKEAPHVDNYQSVFPNFKHGERSDGLGYPKLSPMSLGPIYHGQPGLPAALNLENLFQSNKLMRSELTEDGRPGPEFYKTRLAMYNDKVPHRHKTVPEGDQVVCSIWVQKDGSEIHLKYVESRQIYCHFYEQYAIKTANFAELKKGVESGLNVNIIGYDGYDFRNAKGKTLEEKFETCYLDPSKPFGHEIVICALLLLKPDQYPWRKYKTLDL